MSEGLKPCPLCSGELFIYISDATETKFCGGSPCWDAGAMCERCGVGFCVGTIGAGVSVDSIEAHILKTLNTRPDSKPEYRYDCFDDARNDGAVRPDYLCRMGFNAARETK